MRQESFRMRLGVVLTTNRGDYPSPVIRMILDAFGEFPDIGCELSAIASRQTMTIAEVLLSAIKESGQTQGQISYGSGVWQSTLCRFIHRKRGLTLDVADKLAAYFHLELRKVQ